MAETKHHGSHLLTCYGFGRQLVSTGDLDPIYILLWESDWEQHLLRRWLIAYWAFYHVGTASWIAEAGGKFEEAYWQRFGQAASSKEWPRSAERRHYRGKNAASSLQDLQDRGLVGLWKSLTFMKEVSASQVMGIIQGWTGFGPWIAFKVADMLERLNLAPIRFSIQDSLYESPLKGAELLWEQECPGLDHHRQTTLAPHGVGPWAVERILSTLNSCLAPPRYERELNCQEAETILCKFHAYSKGHYHMGEDIAACRKALLRFASCPLSQELIKAGKKGGIW